MRVSYFGHSCFQLQGSDGISILIDPFDEDVGYPLPRVYADIVLISHDHSDHNNIKIVRANPAVVRGPGRHYIHGMEFRGVETCHDEEGGSLRGANTIFCFSLDGIRVCHLGDLGHTLGKNEVLAVGPVDVLFIPVGGIYTLDASGADKVIEQLAPRIIVPMHYWTYGLSFDLDPVENFLKDRDFDGPFRCFDISKDEMVSEGRRIVVFSRASIIPHIGAPFDGK